MHSFGSFNGQIIDGFDCDKNWCLWSHVETVRPRLYMACYMIFFKYANVWENQNRIFTTSRAV